MASKKNGEKGFGFGFVKIIDCEEEIQKIYHGNVKPKRIRRKLSNLQVDALEKIYEKNSYPSKEEYATIFIMLSIPMKNCKIWFQNRRAKDKNANADSMMEIFGKQPSKQQKSTGISERNGRQTSHIDYSNPYLFK